MTCLFENNRLWAEKKSEIDPDFFQRLEKQQKPKYLWIGCSDSRVPPNELLGLQLGDIFVHRNVANLFLHTDLNALAVLQYGIEYLHIEHVIVCGHYMCGGIAAAMERAQHGLVDHWLCHVRGIYAREKDKLAQLRDSQLQYDRLVELNVIEQVRHVCHTTMIQNAWAQGKKLFVHGLVYDLSTGLLKDLKCSISSINQIEDTYRTFS